MSKINSQLPSRLPSESEILMPVRSLLGDIDRDVTALLLGWEQHKPTQTVLSSSWAPSASILLFLPGRPAATRLLPWALVLHVMSGRWRNCFAGAGSRRTLILCQWFSGCVWETSLCAHSASSSCCYDLAVWRVRLSLTEAGDTASREESDSVVPDQGGTWVE